VPPGAGNPPTGGGGGPRRPLDLAALARRLPARPLTRFAPSPTGYLHLGHVANAVYVWGIARALGGRVLLRIEDHDRGRCRPAYDAAVLEDLAWLGLAPDGDGGDGVARQSDAAGAYEAALDGLRSVAPVYACDCSRREIAAGAAAADRETPYPGRCRTRGLAPGPGRGIRVALGDGAERFDDALLGPQEQRPAEQCGDLLVRDRLGNWTYQFAVTADDARQGVDLVIRGADLLDSTGRQLRLARLLGRREPPVYLHHPLILKPSGAKLSKSDGDTGVRELRAAGLTPAAVLGRAAFLTGLLDHPRDLDVRDLPGLFGRPGL
jgi:glutamyl-Q tRNA(Asp) synthetase